MKYNKKVVDNICGALSRMSSKTAAAESGGISLETYYKWYNNIPEFKKRVDKTLDELADRSKYVALQSVFRGMETDPKVAMWYLERKHTDEYGRKDRMDMDVNEKKIVFQIGAAQSEDMIKLIDMNEEEEQKQIE